MFDRRRVLRLSAASTAFAFTTGRATAQEWPNRYVRAIVPFPPGGSVDILARLVGAHVAELWGHQMVVENKPGAGGNIGNEVVARAQPDGYTVLFTQGSIVVNRYLYPSLSYNPATDFSPVSLLVSVPNVLVVPASLPVNSVAELLDHAKTKGLTYGHAGNGTSSHLCGELFRRKTSLNLNHVPYRGTSLVLNDLIAGRLEATMDNVAPLLPHIQSGKLRALAVTTTKSIAVLPHVRPISELGVPDFNVAAWVAALVPAKTPLPVIEKLHSGIVSALAQPATREKLEATGSLVIGSSPAELERFLQTEADVWGPLINDAKIRIDG